MRKEVVLSGSGGQGLLMAGVLLGEAAALYENVNVTQSQSYGVQARGGASRSDVIISDEDINYAEIEEPDILLAISQEALEAYGPYVKEDAIIVVDQDLVYDLSVVKTTNKIYKFPITQIAYDNTKRSMLANVVALGILAELTGIVSPESLEKEVAQRAPAGTEELNKKALLGGINAVKMASAH